MLEVRIHGRGGQGVVVASQILAEAAFREGMHVQAFPSFGSERRGAPVAAFVRMARDPVQVRTQIYHPDGLIVLDQNLILQQLVDVASGLKEGGWVVVNSSREPEAFSDLGPFTVATVDASGIAVRYRLGSPTSPIVNTAILGAMAVLTGVMSLDNLDAAIRAFVPVKPDENAAAAREAADATQVLQGVDGGR